MHVNKIMTAADATLNLDSSDLFGPVGLFENCVSHMPSC